MSEYKVTVEGVVPGFFSNKVFTEVEIYEADSAKEAKAMAQAEINKDKEEKGLSRISILVKNVEKL